MIYPMVEKRSMRVRRPLWTGGDLWTGRLTCSGGVCFGSGIVEDYVASFPVCSGLCLLTPLFHTHPRPNNHYYHSEYHSFLLGIVGGRKPGRIELDGVRETERGSPRDALKPSTVRSEPEGSLFEG